LYRALKGIRKKEITVPEKISNFMERTKMLLLTGSARKTDEIFNEFFKNRTKFGGFWRYYAWMQFVSKVCIPTFYGFLHAIYYGLKSESNVNPKDFMIAWADGIIYEWERIFYVQQKDFAKKLGLKEKQFNWAQAANPFHLYARDAVRLGDWWTKGGFIRWNQKAAKEMEQKFQAQIDLLQKQIDKANELKTQGVNKANELKTQGVNKANELKTQVVNKDNDISFFNTIDNTRVGFIAWCNKQVPKRIYKPGSYINGYAQTMDGQDWQWNGKTFEPY